MRKLKIVAVTVSRADYGLLYPLLKKINEDERFQLDIVATGTHLSNVHGKTVQNIKNDELHVHSEIPMTVEDDTENGMCKSIAKGLERFSSLFSDIRPDLLIVLGDRYELWAVCTCAVIHKVPIVHIHGGEVTTGAIDEAVRHSVTKMASIHFPSIELYGRRIIQMGEKPERVHVVGALGIDNIKNITLMDIKELSEFAGIDFKRETALMTFHPTTLDHYSKAEAQIDQVLKAMLNTQLFTLITMPNADTGWNSIYEVIQRYVQEYPDKFKLVKNLGQKGYLSAMKYSRIMVGNSSSGIIESASFGIPVVNIGDRQAGRFKPGNIIDCECTEDKILTAISQALSDDFSRKVTGIGNPYGDGNTADRIVEVLGSTDFLDKDELLKKSFYDINF